VEMAKKTFKNEIIDYWSKRSETYGQQHHEELLGEPKALWQNVILSAFNANENPVKKILDIGTGPGFLSILLAEKGFEVTSIDMTEEMLIQAKLNAGDLVEKIEWTLMDAHKLTFDTAHFDAIVTRNVTWNLENPKEAYKEWYRVLKPGGILLNFDSNWYKYLYDETLREKYEKNRELTQEMAVKDYYEGTDIDWMEDLAKEMPLSKITRPIWDKKVLKECGFQSITIHENMNDQLLSDIQKINFLFSPIFLIEATK